MTQIIHEFLEKSLSIAFVAALLLAVLNFYDYIFYPHSKGAFKEYAGKHKKDVSGVLADFVQNSMVEPIGRRIQLLVRLDEVTTVNLERDLERAGFQRTPKAYYANAIAAGMLVLPFFVLGLLTGKGWMMVVSLLFGALITYLYIEELPKALSEKKQAMEHNLPKFIRTVVAKIIKGGTGEQSGKVDLINVFEDYARVADDVFRYDINKLIMDMKTMSHEDAFTEFEKRINLPDASQLVANLKALERGENQVQALTQLSRAMETRNREAIRRRLEQEPKRIRMVTYLPAFAGCIALIYVMVMQIVWSMEDMF